MTIECQDPVKIPGMKAAADYSTTGQYLCVKMSAADTVAKCSVLGEAVLGVLQNAPEAGEACEIQYSGISKCVAGAAVTLGANVTVNASGQVIDHSGSYAVLGVALAAASAAGEIIPVLLRQGGGVATTNNRSIMSFPLALTALADGEDLFTFTPGFAGHILSIACSVDVATTDQDADGTLQCAINDTLTTGGLLTLADDNVDTQYAAVAGSAITALNSFDDDDVVTIVAGVTNAFSDGNITVYVVISG